MAEQLLAAQDQVRVAEEDLVTTARTYAHVVVDERELDYAALLA